MCVCPRMLQYVGAVVGACGADGAVLRVQPAETRVVLGVGHCLGLRINVNTDVVQPFKHVLHYSLHESSLVPTTPFHSHLDEQG